MNLQTNVPALDWVCYSLLIIGALNWGAIGVADLNLLRLLLESIFQPGVADLLARVTYALIGLAGLYFFYPLYRLSTRATAEPGTTSP